MGLIYKDCIKGFKDKIDFITTVFFTEVGNKGHEIQNVISYKSKAF